MDLETVESITELARKLRLMVYGEPGTGKTWFGASAALDELTSPVLYINYKGQIASLRASPKYMQAIRDKRLVILTLKNYAELDHAYTWLYRGAGSRPTFDKEFPEFPKTVVIDSITELQRSEVMRIAGNKPGKFTVDMAIPKINQWGKILNTFTSMADLFYHLDLHVIITGLESTIFREREVGKEPKAAGYRIALQGSGQTQVPAYALTLMRLDRAPANADHYAVGYTSSSMMKTKEQTGMLPKKIPGPTIPMLARLLQKEPASS